MKQRKHSFQTKIKVFALVALALICTGVAFAIANPQGFGDCLTYIGIGVGSPVALAFGPGLIGSIHLDPGGGGGGGNETPEQKAKRELFEGLKRQTDEQLAQFLKDNAEIIKLKAAVDKITTIEASIAKATPETIEAVKADLVKALADIKALKESPKISIGEDRKLKANPILEILEKNSDKIEAFKDAKTGSLTLADVDKKLKKGEKADMTSTDIADRDAFFTWHEGGKVGEIPYRKPFLRELFTNKISSSEYIKYLDQASVERTPQNTVLCTAPSSSDTKATYEVLNCQVKKIKDYGDVCLDMLQDYAFVQGEVQRLFDTSLRLGIDAQLLTGNGAGANLNGLSSVASTFSAFNADPTANYEDAVVVSHGYANLIDLIGVAGAQIKAFGQNNFWMPNYVLLNPRDFHQLFLLKDSIGNYIKNNQLFQSVFTSNGVGRYFINGIEVIENPGITQNTAYIGDFRKGTVYSRGNYGLELSYENRSNFEEEVVTVKVYERLNLLIRNVDANAFMKITDIEQALFDITAPT